jgi:hypothetical protein
MQSGCASIAALCRQDSMDANLVKADAARVEVERLNMLVRELEDRFSYVICARNALGHEWNDRVVDDLLDLARPPCAVPVFAFEWGSGEVFAKMRCSFQDSASGKTRHGWVRVVVSPVLLRDARTGARSYVLRVEAPYTGTAEEAEWELRHPLCPHARAFFRPRCVQ